MPALRKRVPTPVWDIILKVLEKNKDKSLRIGDVISIAENNGDRLSYESVKKLLALNKIDGLLTKDNIGYRLS